MRNWRPYIPSGWAMRATAFRRLPSSACAAKLAYQVGLYRVPRKRGCCRGWRPARRTSLRPAQHPLASGFAERLRPALPAERGGGHAVPVLSPPTAFPATTIQTPRGKLRTQSGKPDRNDARSRRRALTHQGQAQAAIVAERVPGIPPKGSSPSRARVSAAVRGLDPTVEETLDALARRGSRPCLLQP